MFSVFPCSEAGSAEDNYGNLGHSGGSKLNSMLPKERRTDLEREESFNSSDVIC